MYLGYSIGKKKLTWKRVLKEEECTYEVIQESLRARSRKDVQIPSSIKKKKERKERKKEKLCRPKEKRTTYRNILTKPVIYYIVKQVYWFVDVETGEK